MSKALNLYLSCSDLQAALSLLSQHFHSSEGGQTYTRLNHFKRNYKISNIFKTAMHVIAAYLATLLKDSFVYSGPELCLITAGSQNTHGVTVRHYSIKLGAF